MGSCEKIFYDPDKEVRTLTERITLSERQLDRARSCKDRLLACIKPELGRILGIEVRHWLQGSYKNHTLVRPTSIFEEFDIDVGLYLFCNAPKIGIQAHKAKSLLRRVLEHYVDTEADTELQPPKESCERLAYPPTFHIDLPLYYFDADSDTCQLATQSSGWTDSDPKALQDWFDEATKHLDRAKLRRAIRYLKIWVALKWSKETEGRIPSVALTVLVVKHFQNEDGDDLTLAATAISISTYLASNSKVSSPVNGDDLLGLTGQQLATARERLSTLASACQTVLHSNNSYEQYLIWAAIFEHMFPPYRENGIATIDNTNLPTITRPPQIQVVHHGKAGNILSSRVTTEIVTYQGEHLDFCIDNVMDYPSG